MDYLRITILSLTVVFVIAEIIAIRLGHAGLLDRVVDIGATVVDIDGAICEAEVILPATARVLKSLPGQ